MSLLPSPDASRLSNRRRVGAGLALAAATGAAVWIERTTPGVRAWLVDRAAHDFGGLANIWWVLGDLGLGESLIMVLAAVLVIGGSRRRLQDGAVAVILAGVVANLLKVLVMRDRPVANVSYAWPSGHSAAAAALVAALAGWRPTASTLGWVGAVAVGVSRVMRGRHWPGDVLGGLLVGYACGWAARRLPSFLPRWVEEQRVRVAVAWGVVAWWSMRLAWRPADGGTDLLIAVVPVLACGLWACSRTVADGGGGPRWRAGLAAATLFVGIAVVGHAGAGGVALLDVDEPRFAAASRTMLATGDWIVPWFNGAERFDKPALVYWLQAAALALVEPVEAAVRLPSALGVALAAAAAMGIGRLLGLGVLPALLAGVIAGTAPMAQGLAHGATADGLLYGLATAIGFVQVWRYRRGTGLGSALALWTGVAAAFLTKGPPALVGPLALGLGLTWAGARPRLAPMLGGIAWAAVLVAAWAVPVLIETEGGFFTRGVMYHVVERSLRPFEGHGGFAPWWLLAYLVTIPLTMLPWTLLLPWAATTLRGAAPAPTAAPDLDGRTLQRILGGWVLGVVGTFTLVVSKLPHYVLPCYPALALAILLGRWQNAMPVAGRLSAVVGLAFAIALPLVPLVAGFEAAVVPGMVAGAGFGATLWLCGRWLRQGRTLHAVAGMALGVCLGMAVWFGRVLPAADPQMLARAFAAELPVQVHAGETVHLHRLVVPSATFYLGRVTPPTDGDADALRLLTEPGHLVLMRDRERDRLLRVAAEIASADPGAAEAARAVLAEPLWSARGFLPSKGRAVAVVLCGRRQPTSGSTR